MSWENGSALGRVESVQLRIRIIGIEPSLNDVRIELNGQPLPDSMLDIEDLNYRLISTGAVGPYGQVYKYQLPPAYYPKPGHNAVCITLVKRDPNIENPLRFTMSIATSDTVSTATLDENRLTISTSTDNS